MIYKSLQKFNQATKKSQTYIEHLIKDFTPELSAVCIYQTKGLQENNIILEMKNNFSIQNIQVTL